MPCPTPTSAIDQHRVEVDQVGDAVGRARKEERALRARRDEAARRAEATQAGLDSLRTKGSPR